MRREKTESRSFNLVPVMNLVTVLVPIALMATQFVAMRLLDPGPEPGLENPGDAELREVVPVIEISRAGFRIVGAEEVLAGPDGRPFLPCASEDCLDPGAYDYRGLRRLLGHVKDAYPWADEVVFVADDIVAYDVLMRAMDSAREDTGQRELFPRVRLRRR